MGDEDVLNHRAYWEQLAVDYKLILDATKAENAKLRDLLRWRDAWGEPPTEHGNYLVHRYAFYGDSAIMTLHWNGSWPMRAITHWRPIGPLPEGG